MKILVIGPSWVGDMVMSQSLYITLKELYPDCQIDVIAPGWCKPILDRMPEVHQAIEMPLGHGEFNLLKRHRLGRQLKDHNYTHAYICPNSAKSALIPWFAGIPKRTGWKGEMRYGLLNDLRPNKKNFQYMVERYVALAHPKTDMIDSSSLGGLENLPHPKLAIDITAQQQTLEKYLLSQERAVIGLCPGAEFGPSKQWPVTHYAQVANEMINQGQQVWLFGSAKDKETTQSIKSLVEHSNQQYVFDLAGKTSLIEVVDLLAACKSVVSNDSGLMHVAAAVGCHVVGVYGSTSPKYTPPLAKQVDIISTNIECRPCFKRECPLGHSKCLKDLKPDQVLKVLV
ncbi:lipopolysaccharide heptosyltransferase II [Vibrio splendidus]|uniref:lipopolysaccharide heptosyltransferase II n=1 Tax=Vibrio splendidus TaxID=29497 RepID=A0A2T5ESC2_VIBSP|nr:lipopolysaccharide heptosyltransferase II [Vibrio splendidus]OEF82582.1 lipopolysaccharide heptosyltransferase II [Vibrio splendidus 1F-157]PMI15154.1 lipopolysaccharide heptosyltransferase II [Vibrio splendidus]PMJ72681.1 lipopolysaccharide heptosyltransferase II [Vibrio splendidus]PTP29314.1 lipopolysaccharide heptosyltransferase II [Vibrio splendidus]PTP73896.1 lipopolysaccharide heptosyltransferase II [Vibrio splendidus]